MNNETAWNKIFEDYQILDKIHKNGSFRISADDIKKYREPRLMTKFDFHSQLPTIFKKENLSILPITRGDYIISDIKTFETLPNNNDTPLVDKIIPNNIESLDFSSITSEAIAINLSLIHI